MGTDTALPSLERKITGGVGGATASMCMWTALARHRLFCQGSCLATLKLFSVQKPCSRGAPPDTPPSQQPFWFRHGATSVRHQTWAGSGSAIVEEQMFF